MKISQHSTENGEAVLEIEVEPERVQKHLRRASQGIRIDGFRQGKAPMHIVMQFIERETLMEAANETLLPEVTKEAIKQQGLDAFDSPSVEVPETDPVMKVNVTVPLRPSVELADYKALRIDDLVAPVTDADVDATVEQLRRSFSVTRPVDRAAAVGDVVVFSGNASVGDSQLFEVEDREYLLDPENDIGIEGFREALVGMSEGESKDFSGAFASADTRTGEEDEGADDDDAGDDTDQKSDDSEEDDDAGEPAVVSEARMADVHVKVVGVKEVVLPELDDELAVTVGIDGLTTLDALRERIRDDTQMERERQAEAQYETQVIETLSEQSEFHLSEIVVRHEASHILERELERRWRMQGGRGPRLQAEDLGDDVEATAMRIAESNLKRALLLDEVAEQEGIEIGDVEVVAEFDRQNELAREQAKMLREARREAARAEGKGEDAEQDDEAEDPPGLEDTAETRENIRHGLRNRRAIEILIEYARGDSTDANDGDGDDAPESSSESVENQAAAVEADDSSDAN